MLEASALSLFLLGLLGSGHCLGMCGPLVLALPGQRGTLPAHLAYHLGRVFTYTAVGAALGGVQDLLRLGAGLGGDSAAALRLLAQAQLLLALVAAGVMLLLGLHRLGLVAEPRWLGGAPIARLLRPSWRARGDAGLVVAGLALGLLPCGLSYAAFATALSSGSAWRGGLLCLSFGLGTLPSLLLFGGAAARLSQRHRRLSDLLAGSLTVGLAAWLLLRSVGGMS